MTDQCLSVRNHFAHRHSGTSTFRRSLGAILRSRLSLRAIPRSPGSKPHHYRFTDDGEQRLTAWMGEYLQVRQRAVPVDSRALEKRLIAALCPALNLNDWPNPQRALMRELRSACAIEAQQGG